MVDRDQQPGQEPTPERTNPLAARFAKFIDSMAVITNSDATDADPLRYGSYWLRHEGPVPYDRAVVEIYQFRYDAVIDEATGDETYVEYRKLILKDHDIVVHETTLENGNFFFLTDNGTDLHYPAASEGHRRVGNTLDWLQNGNMVADDETRNAIEWLNHPAELIHSIAVDMLSEHDTTALLLAVHDPIYRRLLIRRENEDLLDFNLYSRWLPTKDPDMDDTVWTRRLRSIQLDTTAKVASFSDSLQFAVHRSGNWEAMAYDTHGLDQLGDEQSTDMDVTSLISIGYMLRTRSRFSDHVESTGEQANAITSPYPAVED